jgi:hypothetical protein
MAADRSSDPARGPGIADPPRNRVEGVLDHRWAAWFGGLRVDSQGAQTVIYGRITDQPLC